MECRLDEARQVLQRTPGVLRTMLDGLSDVWLLPNEGAETWSPRDVVAHLVGAERDLWIPRTRHLLEFGEDPPFPPFNRTAEIVASADRPVHDLLLEFARLRHDSLQALDALRLSPSQLDRTGTHPEFGVVRLHDLMATWVVHDLSHTAQIVRVMAMQYRDEVGPWRANLRVIR
jgi:DinB superfamily